MHAPIFFAEKEEYFVTMKIKLVFLHMWCDESSDTQDLQNAQLVIGEGDICIGDCIAQSGDSPIMQKGWISVVPT